MAQSYTYEHLSKEILVKLQTELNESPENVNAHINSLQRYLKNIPHLNCPKLDAKCLLKFLRVAKFDHQRAQRRIDNFCTCRRSSEQSCSRFYRYPMIGTPKFAELMAIGTTTKLGYNQNNEVVILIQAANFNVERTPLDDYIMYVYMVMDVLSADEMAQIGGISIVIDLANMTQKSLMAFADSKTMQQMTRNTQECYPIRNKTRIFTNEPIYFEILFKIMQFFLSEKQRARAFRLKSNMNEMEAKMPGLTAILPTEYNGLGGPLADIKARWEKEFLAYFQNGDPFDEISVIESQRPSENKNLFVQHGEYKGEVASNAKIETKGTYTKFDD